MRFSVPRSTSPSPVRSYYRGQSTFGVPDSSDDEFDSSDTESVHSSSTDSFCYASESEVPPPPPRPKREGRTLAEQHYIEDTLAAIRLRVTHHDPYEEWEKETKRDAFRSARQEHAKNRIQRHQDRNKAHAEEAKRRAVLHKKQMEEVQAQLSALNMQREAQEKNLKAQWSERNRQLWVKIEAVIKIEEDMVKAKLEAEKRKKEEAERKRKEEEDRKRREAEAAAEKARLQKEKEEQERRQAEEDRKREEEEFLRRAEGSAQEEAELAERIQLGITTARDDWARGRELLKTLKAGAMKIVKMNPNLKAQWNAGRRELTAKFGQLTTDSDSINAIGDQIIVIVIGNPPHETPVYYALLSSLSKALLQQAEMEVAVEKRSAKPLAEIAVRMMLYFDGFPDVFWAKLCQYAGNWVVPFPLPFIDYDGMPLEGDERAKAQGRRPDETVAEFIARVSGIMRVFFHILCTTPENALDTVYRLPRYWAYFARMLQQPKLLESPIAPELMLVALDVGDTMPRDMWGQQWVKMLEVLYEGVTVGLNGVKIGGQTPEGIAGRVRVQNEVERLMAAM
ncbi:hypothetical protein SCP_0602850 [Sparassis crispa]|uniref:mRNA export factor GLE1 n=1 Tax=Sparassis crispa TaxID=139825 RepID=A0A401GQ10_9APHY|nr:hypothetical protein SCP_0602850 [Sparassis crispa]GBE84307.1 hypothetical protein SCP_0602850 [Sparassis crispa]